MRAILDGRFGDAPDHIERFRDLGGAAPRPRHDSIHLVQRFWLAVEAGGHAVLDALVDAHERIFPCSYVQTSCWSSRLVRAASGMARMTGATD